MGLDLGQSTGDVERVLFAAQKRGMANPDSLRAARVLRNGTALSSAQSVTALGEHRLLVGSGSIASRSRDALCHKRLDKRVHR